MDGLGELRAEGWHHTLGDQLSASCKMAPATHTGGRHLFPKGHLWSKGQRPIDNTTGPACCYSPLLCCLCLPYSAPLFNVLSPQESLTVPTAHPVTTVIMTLTLPTTKRIHSAPPTLPTPICYEPDTNLGL